MKNQEIKRELDLIQGFVEAAELTLTDPVLDSDLRMSLLDGYMRDIAARASVIKDLAYQMKLAEREVA